LRRPLCDPAKRGHSERLCWERKATSIGRRGAMNLQKLVPLLNPVPSVCDPCEQECHRGHHHEQCAQGIREPAAFRGGGHWMVCMLTFPERYQFCTMLRRPWISGNNNASAIPIHTGRNSSSIDQPGDPIRRIFMLKCRRER
jgi:hypothetical protein